MKILITGAGGFLGQYIARNLEQTHEVIALTRQQLDLSNPISVHEHFVSNHYDVVVNCAAAGRNTPTVEDWSIQSNNVSSVLNLMTYRNSFGKLVNIGSGAEFDISKPIDLASEDDIFDHDPSQSYGRSKNIIARYLSEQPNCFTLRLFGCFDNSEDDRRLFKKLHSTLLSRDQFNLVDREFDMISAADFVTILQAVISNQIVHKNINCVYAKKYRLSDILKLYCSTHNLDPNLINITGEGLNYTGNGDILSKYHRLSLIGLEQSISQY